MTDLIRPYADDRQYFKGWEKIYAAFNEDVCRGRNGYSPVPAPVLKGSGWGAEERPSKLRKIVDGKESFRKRVKAGKEAGISYFVERVAESSGLNEFEKWVILYFLSASFDTGRRKEFTRNSIINFLCCYQDTWEKMKKNAYFMSGSRLIDGNILESMQGYRAMNEPEFCLSASFKEEFFAAIGGVDGRGEERQCREPVEGNPGRAVRFMFNDN